MRLITFPWACVALALASPAMAQQSASLPLAQREERGKVGNSADAGHDPRSWTTGRRQQARRGGGQYRGGLADQPAGQCLVCARPSDVDHSDRQGLSDRAVVFRPHRSTLADRMGHQLQSGRPGQQRRQLQSGACGRRGSCGRERRVLCLYADGRIERPASRGGLVAAARRASRDAEGRAEADFLHAGRGGGPTTPI